MPSLYYRKPELGLSQLDWSDRINEGLLGCWIMNEGGGSRLFDSMRRTEGTLTNFDSTSASGYNVGRFGKSLLFDGSNDFVDFGTPAHFNWTGAQSVSLWFKINSLTIANRPQLFAYQINASPFTIQIALGINIIGSGTSEGTGRMCVICYNSGGTGQVFGAFTTRDFSSPSDTDWHHIVGMWTGSLWTMFIDGVEDRNDHSTQIAPDTNSTMRLTVGSDQAGTGRLWNGYIETARFYNRALNPVEINRLHQDPFAGFSVRNRKKTSPQAAAAGNRRRRFLISAA